MGFEPTRAEPIGLAVQRRHEKSMIIRLFFPGLQVDNVDVCVTWHVDHVAEIILVFY